MDLFKWEMITVNLAAFLQRILSHSPWHPPPQSACNVYLYGKEDGTFQWCERLI